LAQIQWCQERLAEENPTPPSRTAEIRQKLNRLLERVAKAEAKTPRGQAIKSRHAPISDHEKAELRRRAEALAAEYDAALPDGDAGLIEAERRLAELEQSTKALYQEFEIDLETEEDLLIPVITEPRNRMLDFIRETAPRTMAGVAVKLRQLRNELGAPEGELSLLDQVLEFVERERIQSSAPRSSRSGGHLPESVAPNKNLRRGHWRMQSRSPS
jgi:DNA repair exonuclease SbcCD ATPase subunit